LFIYPSPNNGQFKVSYYNSAGGNTKQTVIVYDAKGAKVYHKLFTFSGPYQLHDIDLRGKAKGVYFVVIGDANGKKIIDGKVLVH
jgi:serine protease AprX